MEIASVRIFSDMGCETLTSGTSAAGDQLAIQSSRRYGTLSPLRYPGGKAALAGLFGDVISELGISRATYVEPYAGGAGAGIALLRQGLVSRLVINDIDPAVYAFWDSVVRRNASFVDWVGTVPLTLEEWRRQREVYRSKPRDVDSLGRAFFYLNRTNRSGVLHAGVIGGKAQAGAYKIDARFNRDTLASRLQALSELGDSIEVTALDGRTVIDRYRRWRSAFLYVDPPYVRAGSQLYLNAFERRDHEALADAIGRINGAHWFLTYDQSAFIEQLYGGHFQTELSIHYSARHPGKAAELVVTSPSVANVLPQVTKPVT